MRSPCIITPFFSQKAEKTVLAILLGSDLPFSQQLMVNIADIQGMDKLFLAYIQGLADLFYGTGKAHSTSFSFMVDYIKCYNV
jgi:hypothetical protein